MDDESQKPGERIGCAFTNRLNQLIDERALAGEPVANREIVRWMNAHGYQIKDAYLSSLRRGKQASPSLRIIEGLAIFFDVAPSTFLSTRHDHKTLGDPLRTPGIEAVARQAIGLSAENLKVVSRVLDGLRATQNLPALSDESTRRQE